jgi:acetyltransferase-like isoleucine patch superfamily enzyme
MSDHSINPPPHNPFDTGYYVESELRGFGFGSVGENVRIAKNCTIIGLNNISIGSHVRVDSHVTIVAGAGELVVGSYIHIAAGAYLTANGGITMSDFTGLSQGVKLYSATDDYSGNALTNPTVPRKFLNVSLGRIVLQKHVIIGSGSVVLPGCIIGEGSAVGALSLVTKNLAPWGIYLGCPAIRLKARSRKLLELEAQLIHSRVQPAHGKNSEES